AMQPLRASMKAHTTRRVEARPARRGKSLRQPNPGAPPLCSSTTKGHKTSRTLFRRRPPGRFGRMRAKADSEVRQVLRMSAVRLLDRLPELTDELVRRGREKDEAYRLRIPYDDHWQSAYEGLRVGLTAILQPRHERRDVAYARKLGRRRAEHGLPLDSLMRSYRLGAQVTWNGFLAVVGDRDPRRLPALLHSASQDRKSTRLNSSHVKISYAVFCLKKKNEIN